VEVPEPAIALPETTEAEQTYLDYALLGMCLDRHVIALYRRQRQLLHVTPSHRLVRRRDGERIRVAGLVVCRQAPATANCVLFLSLEEEWGLANVVVRPGIRGRYREQVRHAPMLLVEGATPAGGQRRERAGRPGAPVRPLHQPATGGDG